MESYGWLNGRIDDWLSSRNGLTWCFHKDLKMRKIPLCKPAVSDEEIKSAVEVLKSGWMAHGPKNHEFEDQFRDYLGVKHAVTMNSCTSALHLAIEALGIRGEVIVPSFTFVASVNAILLAGGKPVFVDIDEATRNISPERINEAISDKTEAIMVVHYAGLPADMPKIVESAQKHNLRIVEDCAECLGGSYNGVKAGSYDIGCFSFFPTKNITTGEGGMLTTNDDRLASRVGGLCAHGIDSSTYKREKGKMPWLRIASQFGYNFRMSNLLAAIGVEQMKKLKKLNAERQKLAERYIKRLSHMSSLHPQYVPPGFVNSWQMFTILVPQLVRNELLRHLRSHGVGASVHFDPPVHEQEIYRDIGQGSTLETTEKVARSLITLPIFPGMSLDDVDYICKVIDDFGGLR